VRNYIDERSGRLLAEFSEVASGRWAGRRRLREAIKTCSAYRATSILATMDRLARNVRMIADLAESGLDFVAVDFLEANRFMVHVLAALAEYESNLISARVKKGLAVARAKGVRTGRPRKCPPARIGATLSTPRELPASATSTRAPMTSRRSFGT